jgi:hypothetical protein
MVNKLCICWSDKLWYYRDARYYNKRVNPILSKTPFTKRFSRQTGISERPKQLCLESNSELVYSALNYGISNTREDYLDILHLFVPGKGKLEVSLYPHSTPALRSSCFSPGKEAGNSWPIWRSPENLAPTTVRAPDRPAHSKLPYRLAIPVVVCSLNLFGTDGYF